MVNYLMKTYNPLKLNIKYGKGSYLYDDNEKKYLDFTSGIGVNSLGYNNELWKESLYSQINEVVHLSNIFRHEQQSVLAEKLVKSSNMSAVFFSNSGTEANEGAFKLAKKYSYIKYGESRNKILSLTNSFHGRSLASLTATGQDKYHQYFAPFVPGFDYVETNSIHDFDSKLDSSVCAVIIEVIQGEGGVNLLDKDFVKHIYTKCLENDVILIIDEVQSGIGRCGKLFCYEHFDIKPDIVTFAKGIANGLPLGGFLCNDKLSDVFTYGDHGTTFGGNILSCASANYVLDHILNDSFLNEVTTKGDYVSKYLNESNCSNILKVKGKGLMIGIEVTCKASDVINSCLKSGLLVLSAGENIIRLLPPLTISKDELKLGLDILINSINSN